jgi:hypothetical protein
MNGCWPFLATFVLFVSNIFLTPCLLPRFSPFKNDNFGPVSHGGVQYHGSMIRIICANRVLQVNCVTHTNN